MELTGREVIMNTKNETIPQLVHKDIKKKYEFNRFKSKDLKKNIQIKRCEVLTKDITLDFNFISLELWNFVYESLQRSNKKLFCFITASYWREDNRINKYKGLNKLYEIKEDLFIDSGIVNINNSIMNWGLMEITFQNYIKAFYLATKYENSIFFTGKNANQQILTNLQELIDYKSPEINIYMNIPNAINIICSYNESAIYFNGWPETNDYFLDIFYPKEAEYWNPPKREFQY